MTVKQLIEILGQYNEDDIVYLGGYEDGSEIECTWIHNNEHNEPILDFC